MAKVFKFLIAGGGIAGLSAALALTRQGHIVQLAERRESFPEIGAGLQISPNAWRCLRQWGLEERLRAISSIPDAMLCKDMASGRLLGRMTLGKSIAARYGAPYATLRRTDLHQLLLDAACESENFAYELNLGVEQFEQRPETVAVQLRTGSGELFEEEADALLAADGVHSQLAQIATSGVPVGRGGYTAYRGIVNPMVLPLRLRNDSICAWLGRRMHAVAYPVQGGQWLNVVLIIADSLLPGTSQRGPAEMDKVLAALGRQQALHTDLKDIIAAINAHGQPLLGARWAEWPLLLRQPLRSAQELVQGRVALLGDAAHPMVPFLAQGAAMAIEDASQLAQSLGQTGEDLPAALQAYAVKRVGRVALVQRQGLRNGSIFHLGGMMALGRNVTLGLMAGKVMDKPWLYSGGPVPVAGPAAPTRG